MTDERGNDHLTEPQVALLLERLEKVQAVVVGGQALAIWSRLFLKDKPSIASFYSISSEDLDVFGNAQAAKMFAATLDEAEVHVPKAFDDNTPNAAVVIGKIGDRRICIDFMRKILGVDDRRIREKYVTLSRQVDNGASLNIIVLHPLDCLRSRISNINDLHRSDAHSISSARAAVLVLEAFIDELLENNEIREAQDILRSLRYLARDQCYGKAAHLKFNIDPRTILNRYLFDIRLDFQMAKLSAQRSYRVFGKKGRRGRKEDFTATATQKLKVTFYAMNSAIAAFPDAE